MQVDAGHSAVYDAHVGNHLLPQTQAIFVPRLCILPRRTPTLKDIITKECKCSKITIEAAAEPNALSERMTFPRLPETERIFVCSFPTQKESFVCLFPTHLFCFPFSLAMASNVYADPFHRKIACRFLPPSSHTCSSSLYY